MESGNSREEFEMIIPKNRKGDALIYRGYYRNRGCFRFACEHETKWGSRFLDKNAGFFDPSVEFTKPKTNVI